MGTALTAAEAMAAVGIGRRTLYRWVSEGLPHTRAARGHLLIDESELRDFAARIRHRAPERTGPAGDELRALVHEAGFVLFCGKELIDPANRTRVSAAEVAERFGAERREVLRLIAGWTGPAASRISRRALCLRTGKIARSGVHGGVLVLAAPLQTPPGRMDPALAPVSDPGVLLSAIYSAILRSAYRDAAPVFQVIGRSTSVRALGEMISLVGAGTEVAVQDAAPVDDLRPVVLVTGAPVRPLPGVVVLADSECAVGGAREVIRLHPSFNPTPQFLDRVAVGADTAHADLLARFAAWTGGRALASRRWADVVPPLVDDLLGRGSAAIAA